MRRGLGDQARAALGGEVAPGPFKDHQQPIAEADQEEDVDEEPGDPSDPTRDLERAEVRHRRGTPNGGQRPFVAIAERDWDTPMELARDVVRAVDSLLNGSLSNTRNLPEIVLNRGQVSYDVHVVVSGRPKIRSHQHPACPVQRHAQRSGQVRGLDARRPEHGLAG